MISIGGLTGLVVIALLTLLVANAGEAQRNSLSEPDVPFPPGRPTALNLASICQQGQGRPRYPDSFFPRSGASHFRRRGKAINRMESWYSWCCGQESTQILCCAQQAWKQALSQFCVEEYGTMSLPYECCEDRGEARWTCFDSDLPNPDYSPRSGYTAPKAPTAPTMPQEPGFAFNASAC